jgi:hypothetical protein
LSRKVVSRSKYMRQTIIASAATALVTAIVAIWRTAVIVAQMRDAKGLPEESFDALDEGVAD